MSILFLLSSGACGIKHSLGDLTGDTVTETSGDPPDTSTGEPDTASTSSGTSGGDPQQCEDPAVAETGPEVKVRLQNAGDGPVWVDRNIFCRNVKPFDLFDAEDQQLNLDVGLCEFTCEEALIGDCACQAGCGTPGGVIRIDPGATYEVVWAGDHWPEFTIGEECSVGCELTCVARQQVPAGKYKVVARSSGALAEGDCTVCDCDSSEEGWCEMDGDRTGDELIAEAELDYPAQAEVTLVFP